jgi:hypothetical protein
MRKSGIALSDTGKIYSLTEKKWSLSSSNNIYRWIIDAGTMIGIDGRLINGSGNFLNIVSKEHLPILSTFENGVIPKNLQLIALDETEIGEKELLEEQVYPGFYKILQYDKYFRVLE